MATSKTAITVLGSEGRMGRSIIENISNNPLCLLAGQFDVQQKPGTVSEARKAISTAEIVIDFTTPQASVSHATLCAQMKKPLVIGTTGFNKAQLEEIRLAAGLIPVFLSPNMSPAANLSMAAARFIAEKLCNFDISISEIHHKHKKDAPSGTALKFQSCLSATRKDPIAVTSVRAGDIIGEHTVLYAGPHERVELTHRAHSREVFAAGAIQAALWLTGKKTGLYDYFDLLELSKFS